MNVLGFHSGQTGAMDPSSACTMTDQGGTHVRTRYRLHRRVHCDRRDRCVDHRYYDPATGVFLNVDPLVDVTRQPYAYTGNDPVNETDPSGTCVLFFCPVQARIANAAEFGAGLTIIIGADTIGTIAAVAQGLGEPEDTPLLPVTGLLEYELGAANIFGIGLIYKSLGRRPPGTPVNVEPGPIPRPLPVQLSDHVQLNRC
jgi:RHS repeat-associated protein